MTAIDSVALEVPDPTAAGAFYTSAFGLGAVLELCASEEATTGFRGFTLSLVVSQPATVDELVGSALDAGATSLKPAKKGLWGYGGVVRAPDGTIWKVATSAKKNTGPATRQIDDVVLLLGVADVAASKRFYVDRGLAVTRGFGGRYAEFATTHVTLALYRHRALAKDAGVSPEGTGSHRIVIRGDAGPFTDPDGFAWEAAGTHGVRRAATAATAAARNPADILIRHPRGGSMSPPKDRQKPAKRTTGKASTGFTDEERAAMKERARELKAERAAARARSKADGESEVLAKIAEMPEQDRAMAERLHAIIKATAPDLSPRTWYGMPAYAKDGNVICFFQSAQKFKSRYATLGFSDKANLDEGAMWPTAFALKELTAAEEAKITALVKQAVS